MLKPDYNNCIINIVESIKKYYNLDNKYDTNKIIDNILENKPNHVVLMILDGLGSNILEKYKEDCKSLNKYKITDISAVFPPTTSAAIPASITGLPPLTTGWTGWENYVSEIGKKVVFFKNVDYITNDKIENNLINEIYPKKPFWDNLNIPTYEIGPTYYNDGYEDFNDVIKRIINISKNNNKSFSYVYWDNPDYLLHEFGSNDIKVKECLKMLDSEINKLTKLKDITVIITADHGHINCSPIYLKEYKDVFDMFSILPQNEARCTFFHIKDEFKNDFPILFKKYFKDWILLTKEEFLNNEFLGINGVSDKHHKIDQMIGDYVGIAIGSHYFDYVNDREPDMIFKSHHAGLTIDEMKIPLVVLK